MKSELQYKYEGIFNISESSEKKVFNKEKQFLIQNRRYLGNKTKLLGFIESIINSEIGDFYSFCDLFAGTGTVSNYFNKPNNKIIANDILYSNFSVLSSFLGSSNSDLDSLEQKIEYLNSINFLYENYFSITYGGKYFTHENAIKIGVIREKIDIISSCPSEKQLLLTSLIYAVDKVANTVGHFDAYCKNMLNNKKLKLLVPYINCGNNYLNEIYRMDAVELSKKIKCDVLYLDPPYNSRQYNSAYHVLENLIKWEKPEVKGIARKIEMLDTKSQFCTKSASKNFKEIINNCESKFILVSYNNTAKSMHSRSNALISDSYILDELGKLGDFKTFTVDYKGYTTGKAINSNNKERVFFCKVR